MTTHLHGSRADYYFDMLRTTTDTTARAFARRSFNYHNAMYNAHRRMDTTNALPLNRFADDDHEALTPHEEAIRQALIEAPKRNLTTDAIAHCLASPSADSLRQVVGELKQQAEQAPDGLRSALGDELFERVVIWGDGGVDGGFD